MLASQIYKTSFELLHSVENSVLRENVTPLPSHAPPQENPKNEKKKKNQSGAATRMRRSQERLNLMEQVLRLTRLLESAAQDKQGLMQQVTTLTRLLGKASQDITILQDRNASLMGDITAAWDRGVVADQALITKANECADLKHEITALKRQHAEVCNEKDELRTKLNQAKTEQNELLETFKTQDHQNAITDAVGKQPMAPKSADGVDLPAADLTPALVVATSNRETALLPDDSSVAPSYAVSNNKPKPSKPARAVGKKPSKVSEAKTGPKAKKIASTAVKSSKKLTPKKKRHKITGRLHR